jgi:N-acetylglutamate synthase-like GNAT family acetyltransferase
MIETAIEIVDFKPEYAIYFEQYNKAWIQEHYELEPQDLYVLEHPQQAIIDKGGKILFAKDEDTIIGAVAFKWITPKSVELTKMAVGKQYKGKGAGAVLCKAVIEKAGGMGADEVILYSNTLQATAIKLYRQLGFVELPLEKGAYDRANIKMHLMLSSQK